MLEFVLHMLVKGGWVMIPIFLLTWLGWTLIFHRGWKLWTFDIRKKPPFKNYLAPGAEAKVEQWIQGLSRRDKESVVGGALQAVIREKDRGAEGMEARLDEFMKFSVPELEKNLSTIAIFATVAPLMGLLGTVAGMVKTFQVIGAFGTGNQALMSDSIAEALLATQNGLLVAFPLMFMHIALHNKAERIEKEALSLAKTLINRYSANTQSA